MTELNSQWPRSSRNNCGCVYASIFITNSATESPKWRSVTHAILAAFLMYSFQGKRKKTSAFGQLNCQTKADWRYQTRLNQEIDVWWGKRSGQRRFEGTQATEKHAEKKSEPLWRLAAIRQRNAIKFLAQDSERNERTGFTMNALVTKGDYPNWHLYQGNSQTAFFVLDP